MSKVRGRGRRTGHHSLEVPKARLALRQFTETNLAPFIAYRNDTSVAHYRQRGRSQLSCDHPPRSPVEQHYPRLGAANLLVRSRAARLYPLIAMSCEEKVRSRRAAESPSGRSF